MRFEGVVLDAAVLGLPAVRVDGQLRVLMQVAVKLLLPAAHLAVQLGQRLLASS